MHAHSRSKSNFLFPLLIYLASLSVDGQRAAHRMLICSTPCLREDHDVEIEVRGVADFSPVVLESEMGMNAMEMDAICT